MKTFARFAALLLAIAPTTALASAEGFAVEDGKIVDANGRPFVFRGINMAHAWFPKRSERDLPAIAATGANSVRIALGTGCLHRRTPAAEVRQLISWAKKLRLVTILEVHDSTGLGEAEGACPVEVATRYWHSIRDALAGEEPYVIINIANEPRGNVEPEKWVEESRRAIVAMRESGFRHLLMVDGPNWGQDRLGIMRDAAPTLVAVDPLQRLAFDVHMYGDYPDADRVKAYINSYAERRVALIVGEFGDHFRGTDIPAEMVMDTSAKLGSGYLAWSWTRNGAPDRNLDLTTDSHQASRGWAQASAALRNPRPMPTSWGRKVFSTFGEAETASVFGAR